MPPEKFYELLSLQSGLLKTWLCFPRATKQGVGMRVSLPPCQGAAVRPSSHFFTLSHKEVCGGELLLFFLLFISLGLFVLFGLVFFTQYVLFPEPFQRWQIELPFSQALTSEQHYNQSTSPRAVA